MYIKHLVIENFKSHAHCEIDFKPGFNLLIGDNGVGKTSILEAASVALGGYIVGIDDVSSKHFTKDEIRLLTTAVGDGSYHKQYKTPVLVSCTAQIDDEEHTWIRRKSSVKASRSTVEPRDICKLANASANDPECCLPVLNYQSAARTWVQKKESSNRIFDDDFNRTVGYKNCLDEASDQKMLLNWCARMEQISWQNDRPIAEYESVKKALSDFMAVMNERKASEVRFDKRAMELSYIEGGNALPIRYLSAGYQSVVWMVLDIAYRMAVLNPNLKEKAAQSAGVVLIDEPDMHLHPKWQWRIIKALQTVFPNVQFVAATHSPILIASCKNGHLIRVDRDEISYGRTDYGMEINDVLISTQGSEAMDKSIKRQIDAIYKLIDDGEITEAESKTAELEQVLGREHTELVKINTALAFEKSILGDKA